MPKSVLPLGYDSITQDWAVSWDWELPDNTQPRGRDSRVGFGGYKPIYRDIEMPLAHDWATEEPVQWDGRYAPSGVFTILPWPEARPYLTFFRTLSDLWECHHDPDGDLYFCGSSSVHIVEVVAWGEFWRLSEPYARFTSRRLATRTLEIVRELSEKEIWDVLDPPLSRGQVCSGFYRTCQECREAGDGC